MRIFDFGRRGTRLVVACAVLAAIAACGSSPPVRYFSLKPAYQAENRDGTARTLVGIGEIRAPNFRFRSQMVTRGEHGELIVDDFHRWAEPLDHAMHRVVATNVDSLLDDMTVVAFPYDSAHRPAYRVRGTLEQFDVDTTGLAVLIVQWAITDDEDNLVSPTGRSRYEARSDRPGDPAASVAALNELLAAFSRDIADRLRERTEASDGTD